MKRLFAGKVHVHYWAMYFQGSVDDKPHLMHECFEGQVNGLCGARMRNYLLLITGLHTGCVNVTVDFWDKEPPLEDSWEEAVEVSFVVNDPEWTGIVEFAREGWHPTELPRGTYRARYCARNMDAARRKDTLLADRDEPIDEYSLSFWYAPGAPDQVTRQTSKHAAYQHQWADEISRKSGQVAPTPYTQRLRGGVEVVLAKRIRFVAPTYPQKALELGMPGSVTVDFTIDVNGEPTELQVASAHPPGFFDQAALEAVKQWRYEPFILDGAPIRIPDRAVFRFDPQKAGPSGSGEGSPSSDMK